MRLALAIFVCVTAQAADRWEIQYFYDVLNSSLTLADLKFPSAKRGIAVGYILEKEKSRPVALVTSDAGSHWSQVPLKEYPKSLFFLDDGLGWMVTEKGIWQTEESGRAWRKLTLPRDMKDMIRVCFLDRQRGYAVGERKQVWQTADAGVTWTPLAAAAEPALTPERTTYTSVQFLNERDGMIAGYNEPPRRSAVPDWMDPEKATTRRQLPSTLVFLETANGGTTWRSQTASIFGRVTHLSFLPDGSSIGLIEFQDSFQYPSEVYHVSAGASGKSERIFRQTNRLITDILLTKTNTAYLSGTEVTGVVRDNPIAGKVKMLRSTDLKTWEEIPVDYKASAHRTVLATPDEEHFWAATDTGQILRLVH